MFSQSPEAESSNARASQNGTVQSWTTILLLVAVALPAIIAFGLLYRLSLAVPYQDDYNVVLAFATDYHQLPTLKAKVLDIATKQTNDYKLGFEHSVVALELEFTGRVNFAFLVALGDLFLLPMVYLVWRTYQTDGPLAERLIAFFPISVLFFSLTYWESLNWAMAGLQNLPVIVFSLLAIYLLNPKRGHWPNPALLFLSCLSAVLATFSSANGFLLGPIGLLILLRRRAYADCVIWCLSFTLPLAAYLYHYTPYSPSVQMLHKSSAVLKLIYHFFNFLGCAIPVKWAAALLGVVILTVILLAVRSRFDRINPVAFYFNLWILATALLAAWLRGSSSSRYSMYSILLLIFCYSFLGHYLPGRSTAFNKRNFYLTSVLLAVGLCFWGDISAYKHLGARRRMVLSGLDQYRSNPNVNSPMIDPVARKAFPGEDEFEKGALTRAIQQNIYALP